MTEIGLRGDFCSPIHLLLDVFWGRFEIKSPGGAQTQQDPFCVPQAEGTGQMPPWARVEPKSFLGPFLVPVQAARGVYVNISWLSPAASVSTAFLETLPWWGTRQGEGRKPLKKEQIINFQKFPENSIIFTLKSRLLQPCPCKTSLNPFGGEQLLKCF